MNPGTIQTIVALLLALAISGGVKLAFFTLKKGEGEDVVSGLGV
jgi:hypothetical protein